MERETFFTFIEKPNDDGRDNGSAEKWMEVGLIIMALRRYCYELIVITVLDTHTKDTTTLHN